MITSNCSVGGLIIKWAIKFISNKAAKARSSLSRLMNMSSSSIPIRPDIASVNNLIDAMDPLLRYPKMVQSPDGTVYTATEILNFPHPQVAIDKEKLIIHLDLPTLDDASSAQSIASGVFSRSFNDMRKFPHDFTFALFSDVTDQPMNRYFPILDDSHDNATPDMITKIDNKFFVLEFATAQDGNRVGSSFESKKFTYEGPLISRLRVMNGENYCFYGIIVVSPDRVCSNIRLTPQLVNELTARYRCARAIMARLEAEGLQFGEDTLSSIKESIKTQLTSLNYVVKRFKHGRIFSENILNCQESEEHAAAVTSKYYELCLLNQIKSKKSQMFPHPDKSEMTTDATIINNFIKEYNEKNTRMDPKTVIKFPLMKPDHSASLPSPTYEMHPYAELWNEVISVYVMEGYDFLESENLEKIKEIALSDYVPDQDDILKETRKHYHRIRLQLPKETMIEFQKVGVEAKREVRNPELEMYRELKREGISLLTDTSDITKFIMDYDCTARFDCTLAQTTINHLILEATTTYGEIPRHGMEALKWISGTHLYHWCQMVSDIGIELSISMKQHCSRSEFVIKKLRNYSVWLLIKPTKQESHIFVSLMFGPNAVDLEMEGSCFKNVYRFDKYSCTEFISFDESKLTNLVKTSAFLVSQIAQWSRYFEVDYSKPELSPRCWSMIKLTLLVHLDDKHQTEEVMTLMRYVCMERFSSLESISNLKMIEKIPAMCRSRLQAWATMKLIEEMRLGPYTMEMVVVDDGEKQVVSKNGVWKGLRNPYLDIDVQSPQHLIELFYLGYAKNKDEKSNPNQDFQLINKILKYEEKLTSTSADLFGSKNVGINTTITVDKLEVPITISPLEKSSLHPREGETDEQREIRERAVMEDRKDCIFRPSEEFLDLEFHEWARSCVIHSADSLAKHLETLLGQDWRLTIENDILQRLSIITWEELATLKASSMFDPTALETDEGKKEEIKNKSSGRVHTKREKVIIRVIQELEHLGETPMTSLLTALNILESKGGLLVDIFKKNQHGGLREIYVLDLYSRLIQRAVEEIAKAYCMYLPSEVMVHPENKIRRPQHHLMKVAKNPSAKKLNISSSNDASVWNQGHHVLKFTQFMCRLLPAWLKPFYQRSMQLWMTRKIKIPDGIMNLLMEKPDVKQWDPINRLVTQVYRGEEARPWMETSGKFLTIESGMMQGILHYTSSLFHASMLLTRDNLFKKLARKRGFTAETCDMVSSDDSSRITDVVSNTQYGLSLGKLYSILDHRAIKDFSKLFGIRLSPKSTIACNWVMEFNSEWLFRVNLLRPVVKWSFASLGMTEDECLYDRQEVWNVQLTELLEGGAGFYQAHLTQIAQAILHYQILGSSVNPLFYAHANQLLQVPDPSLGFFLMDHPHSAGLFGLSFAHWVMVTSNEDVNKRAALFFRTGEMTTTTKGIVTRGCVIRYGERKRALRLVEESEKVFPNWREDIEKDPKILYSAPRDKKSAALKIMAKLTNPSVMTSLSKNAALTRIIASSVYIINRHAVTLGSAWIKAITNEEDYRYLKKTSLFKEATREMTLGESLSVEEMSLMFPANLEYESCLHKLIICSKGVMIDGGSRKSLRSHIPILSSSGQLPYSLEKMCRWKWFGESLPTSPRILAVCWREYRAMVPWLKDNPEDTLGATTAFENQIQLRNFIARQGMKTRTVHLTGAPVRDSEYSDMIMSALTKNQFPGKILMTQYQSTNESISATTDSISHLLSALNTYPSTDSFKTARAREILRAHPPTWNSSIRVMSGQQSRLAILQYFACIKEITPSITTDLFRMINESKLGVVGGFTDRQHRGSEGKWKGLGTWVGKIGDVLVNLEMKDSVLTRILTEDVAKLREVQSVLSKFISEAGLSTPPNREFSSHPKFDGKTINPSNSGAPVVFNENLMDIHPTNIALKFKYWKSSFRLVYYRIRKDREQDANPTTLISFSPKSWSFQPQKDIINYKRGSLLNHWCGNIPLRYAEAVQILETNRVEARAPLETDSFREFVKVGLLSSLLARGWNFEVGSEFASNLAPLDTSLEYSMMYGNIDEDFFSDIDFDTEELLTFQINTEPDDEVMIDAMAYDWQDVELGLMDLSQNMISAVDIRRGHKLWSELVNHWNKNISPRQKEILCRKEYTEKTEKIASIFKDYFGWDMRKHNPDSERELDPIIEDEPEGDDSDDEIDNQLIIGGDEFWE